MRKSIAVVVLLLMITLLTSWGDDYKPLTKEEALTWLKTITMDELLSSIIRWDYIEKSLPIFSDFSYIAVLTEKDVRLVPNGLVDLSIGGKGGLLYQMTLPELSFKDVVQRTNYFWGGFGVGAGAGMCVGVILTAIVFSLLK